MKRNSHNAGRQLGYKKSVNMFNRIKINGNGFNFGRIRNDTEYLNLRIESILVTIKKLLLKKNYGKLPLPKFVPSNDMIKNEIVHYNKEKKLFFIHKKFLKLNSDYKIMEMMLKAIGRHFYEQNKFKNISLQFIRKFCMDERGKLKDVLKGFKLSIPKENYGMGISLPSVDLMHMDKFVTTLFSYYIQDLLPTKHNNKQFLKVMTAVKASFKR